MATHLKCLSLSPKGNYLAHSGVDGRLKIWNTENDILIHEYTPSSHLSTTCTCLVWSPMKNKRREFKKKKKKLVNNEDEKLIIGIGTVTGSILFFDVLKGELCSEMHGGHNSVVNDICWSEEIDSLFTCSNDQYIVEWAISSNKIKHKWKADRNSIYSLCLVNENTLLSASSSIKWWDIKNRTVLKKFIGHATEVFCLQHIQLPNREASEGSYFLSSAIGDRVINVWQLGKENSSDSLAAFTLADEPISLQVCSNAYNDQNKMLLIVITSSGILQIFEHYLNGKCKTPLKPIYTIQIAYEEKNASKKTKSLPILTACFCLESSNEILIAYGNLMRPKFEKIKLNECSTQTVLIREFFNSFNKESGIDVYKQVVKPSEVTHLVPGIMQPQLSGTVSKKRSLSESKDNISCNELSLGDRIDMVTKPQSNELSSSLSANTMVEVLIQGLQSNDKDLLNRVFDCNQEVMTQTIKLLPIPSIYPLLKQLQYRLQTPTFCNHLKYLKWLKTILLFHTTHLSKCQELDDMIVPVNHLLTSRSECFQKLLQLKGRLNLILSQMEIGKQEETSRISAEPLILYQEESSDEEEIDLMLSHSESDDNWDEMEIEKCDDNDDDDD